MNSPCFAKYYVFLLCFSCAPRCNRLAVIREVYDLKQSSCIVAFVCRMVDLPQTEELPGPPQTDWTVYVFNLGQRQSTLRDSLLTLCQPMGESLKNFSANGKAGIPPPPFITVAFSVWFQRM